MIGTALAYAASVRAQPIQLSQPRAEKEAIPPRIAARDTPADDAAIERRLAQIYSQIEGMDGLRVRVRAGVVALSGEVLTPKAREQAIALARQVEGVVEVEDNTRVVRGVTRQLTPAVEKLNERVSDFIAFAPLLGVALVVILVFWLVAGLIARWDGLYRRLTGNELLRDLMRHLLRTAVILVGLLLAFEILDATALVGAVLGAAGLLGLALGFALRDTVENYIAGILLSVRQPFTHHDRVLIADREGAIVRLTPRATILMDLDGNHVRIPNAAVFNGILVNFTRNPERRFEFDIGVGVDEDLPEVQKLAARSVETMQGVLGDPPPMCIVEALGDFNVILRVYGWMDQRLADFQKVRSEAMRVVKEAFEAAGVTMPEPIYNVRTQPAQRPVEKAKRRGAASGKAIDITRRTDIDREIASDRQAGGQPDLLRPDAPKE
jgi:small-conductance mechanosensitive channel